MKSKLLSKLRQECAQIIKKTFANSGKTTFVWLIADRGLRMMVGLLVGGWTARYLGAASYGLLNYAMAIIAIFSAIAPLGMEGFAVREIISIPHSAGEWLGTIIGFRVIASILGSCMALLGVVFLRPNDSQLFKIVLILAFGLIGQSLESGELMFQANGVLKRLLLPRLGLFFLVTVSKITAIFLGGSLIWFAALTAFEQLTSGLITWKITKQELRGVQRFRFTASRGWYLLKMSWPLTLSALSVILFMKSSQFLLSRMLDDSALGIYSAATRFGEALGVVPMALATSMLPSLMRNHAIGLNQYSSAVLKYFRISVLIALVLCLVLFVSAPWLINILFGPGYRQSVPVMMIHVWTIIFVFLGVARGQHLVTHKQPLYSLIFNLIGFTVSVGLNLLSIPIWGVIGAAIANLISFLLANVVASLIFPATRNVGKLQIIALLSPWVGSKSYLR